uniref:Uncharacterized protein n=1 Tax=Romanomermis culicivorax TaxID=13658 RepID=A0A915ITE3_ROMCU
MDDESDLYDESLQLGLSHHGLPIRTKVPTHHKALARTRIADVSLIIHGQSLYVIGSVTYNVEIRGQ